MIMMLTMIMTVIAAFMGCPGDSGEHTRPCEALESLLLFLTWRN